MNQLQFANAFASLTGALSRDGMKKSNYFFPGIVSTLFVSVVILTLLARIGGAQQRTGHDGATLKNVLTTPDEGRWHLEPGEKWKYKSDPPTSGRHSPSSIKPGFFFDSQTPEKLVHSLEHGIIVIYYDNPPSRVLKHLFDLAETYTGYWDGVIATPKPGLGQTVILTAWRRMLHLNLFDIDQANLFIHAFRGKGPENRRDRRKEE
jgi:hypothetical protein